MPTLEPLGKDIVVRTLREADLPAADRIFRLAFGTFLGLPTRSSFMATQTLPGAVGSQIRLRHSEST
jgi:hypothetical protein